MIYLLYGTEDFLIEQEIKNIIKKIKIDKINISRYNLEEESIKDIIDEACTISLFEDKKLIIVDNLNTFLTKQNEKTINILEEFINNINKETTLILISEKLDERKKLIKNLRKIAEVKECNKTKNITSTVKKMFDDYKIEYKNIDLLIKIVGNDLGILSQEVEKLKTYKLDKIIAEQDILDLASANNNSDIFDLINYIVKKDKENALNIYDALIKQNEEPIKIIVTLANQFRLIYQSKELYKKGNREDTISEILKIHPYRIKLALEKSKNYSSKILLKYLLKLAELDKNIKNGLIDKHLALELFILEN